MWYIDGDKLEEYLHFRANVPVKEYFARMAHSPSLPGGIRFAARTRIAKLFPHCVKAAMWFMANSKEHGTQWWIRHNVTPRIHAYYGSLEAYRAIPDWKHADVSHNSNKPVLLDHGYDESRNVDDLTDAELQKAAAFRGGRYLGNDTWQDADGNTFKASRRLVLLGGHWSPYEMPFPYEKADYARLDLSMAGYPLSTIPWHWDRVAKKNPFFAQLWAPLHEPEEDNVYGAEVFAGWEKKQ